MICFNQTHSLIFIVRRLAGSFVINVLWVGKFELLAAVWLPWFFLFVPTNIRHYGERTTTKINYPSHSNAHNSKQRYKSYMVRQAFGSKSLGYFPVVIESSTRAIHIVSFHSSYKLSCWQTQAGTE